MSDNAVEKTTYTEHVEMLTGYDEQAIEAKFGADFDSLRFTMQLRALLFIEKRRNGADDKTAHKASMEIRLKALGDHFADEEPEVDADEPITEQGKELSAAD